MPAHWVNLIRRIDAVLDAADRDLDDLDRTLFHEHAIKTLHSRRKRRPPRPFRHPSPTPPPHPLRDPTGDS